MRDSIPSVFSTVCKIAGLNDADVNAAWTDVWNEGAFTVQGWINEFVKEKPELLEKLGQKRDGQNTQSDLERFAGELSADDQKKLLEKCSEIMVQNMDSFFGRLKEKMTFEQRQVADSYLKTN